MKKRTLNTGTHSRIDILRQKKAIKMRAERQNPLPISPQVKKILAADALKKTGLTQEEAMRRIRKRISKEDQLGKRLAESWQELLEANPETAEQMIIFRFANRLKEI